MVAYSFHKRFAPAIERGTKDGTIRADRKRHARPGEAMQLFTSMRTRYCRLLGAPRCVSVNPIRLDFPNGRIEIGDAALPGWYQNPSYQLDSFAQRDGFDDWADMRAFWAEHHPATPIFSGFQIRWDADHFLRRAAV
ncbi:hypothetical protein BA190_27685 [Labrys sp. WJW]|uniref:hypothetical protein n=1 Tax=Labrys sp. WJW TaxID=1737983 RepID=UPI00082EA19C|nr:hypothetical protein [Labrys sp. WJW]OCC01746.1 hypothetical protein BA190_27685 [Labrys sp. WJW]